MAKKKIKDNKDKSGKSDSSEEMDEIVDDIYDGDESSTTIQKPARQHGGRLLYLLLILLFGFLAGVLGELFINNYLYYQGYDATHWWEPPQQTSDEQQVIVFKKEEVADSSSNQVKTLLDNASGAVMGLYLQRGGTEIDDQVYQPKDKLGNALVLTSDGWLATTVTAMPTESGKDLVVIGVDNKVYSISKIVLDKASQVVFLKIEANNLKVVKFADNQNVYVGLPVLVIADSLVSDGIQSQMTNIEKVHFRYINGFADYFQSSEVYKNFYLTKSNLDKSYWGGPVVDMEGGIIGLYSGNYNLATVIPVNHFIDVFNDLLKSQVIDRPYLGVNYIDLAIARGLPVTVGEDLSAGALIFGDQAYKVTAVEAKSPAAKVSLKLGDIILQVNDDKVDARHSLTELIQQYKVGDVVKLVVQNAGEIREIEVGLVAQPEN